MKRLPSEPSVDKIEISTTIRFRLPGGNTASRRFLAAETLQVRKFFRSKCLQEMCVTV